MKPHRRRAPWLLLTALLSPIAAASTPLPGESPRARNIVRRLTGGARGAAAAPKPTTKYGANPPPATLAASPEAADSPAGQSSRGSSAREGGDRKTPSWLPAGLIEQIPAIQMRIDPTTNFKLRKVIPLVWAKLEIGADFNSQISLWQFRTSCEDNLIHGKVTINGRQLQVTKTWSVNMGDNEMLSARLRLKAGCDLFTGRSYLRFGFRTEEAPDLQANFLNGFPFESTFNVDGRGSQDGHLFLELKYRVKPPRPSLEFKSESVAGQKRLDLGMGDIIFSVDEINLLCNL